MKPHLKVIQPGLHTTIQDVGRFGFQSVGVPVSGALEVEWLRLANALVGNPQETAGFEILLAGPNFEVCADSVVVAVAGSGAELDIRGDQPRRVPAWQSVRLRRGQVIGVRAPQSAACCYLAVAGGFAIAPCLGSLSTYVRGGLGGFQGRELRAGDEVPLALERAPDRPAARADGAALDVPPGPIRVILGPQRDCFTAAAIDAFLGSEYIISDNADRMGMRLVGPTLAHRDGYDIVSDGIATGAIQVPGSRQPIVLLADHQTTGGYPKVATVISADLPAVGRRRPGDRLRFAAVDVATAERLRREREALLRKVIERIEVVRDDGGLDLDRLYKENIVSGVVSGFDGTS
jgi:biotin-dependent carboxylase-like uncharacterized protein